MTKKVIALQGKSNTGKTTTIHALIGRLLAEKGRFKYIASEGIGYNKGTVKDEKVLIERLNSRFDTWVVFENIETHEKIGITSRGDAEKYLDIDFAEMKKSLGCEECDTYICAVHTYGDTVKFLIDKFGVSNVYLLGRPEITKKDYKTLNDRDVELLYNNL